MQWDKQFLTVITWNISTSSVHGANPHRHLHVGFGHDAGTMKLAVPTPSKTSFRLPFETVTSYLNKMLNCGGSVSAMILNVDATGDQLRIFSRSSQLLCPEVILFAPAQVLLLYLHVRFTGSAACFKPRHIAMTAANRRPAAAAADNFGGRDPCTLR